MDTFWHDLRYGLRMLLKSPVLTAVALISLALGIGANSAIFAIVDALLWRPLPVEKPQQLAAVFTTDQKNPGFLPVSTLNYEDYRDQNQVFTGLAAYGFVGLDLTAGGETTRIIGLFASANYFDVLGLRMLHGRGFRPEEGRALGGEAVVVLSHSLWQQRLGGDPDIVGKTITLNRMPFTVVGVVPKEFTGTIPGFSPAAWVPYTMRNRLNPAFAWFTESRRGIWLNLIGRLKPGVSLRQAQAGLEPLAKQLEEAYPDANRGRGIALTTLAEARANPTGAAQNPLPLMVGLVMVAVGVILLIACANVANLLLARAASRQKEIAVRIALGAGRARLVRLLLTESVLLGLLAGACGLLVAFWGIDLLLKLQPPGPFPLVIDARLDFRVLAFTLGIGALTGMLFGLVPALQTTRPDVHEELKEGGRQMSGGAGGQRVRKALVVAEVALALVALVGAGLFARSLNHAMTIHPGFARENIITMNLDVSLQGYQPPEGEQLYRRLVERVSGLPGVKSATLASRLPLSFGLSRTVYLEGQVPSEQERGVLVNVSTVDAGYFETVETPLVRGREFEQFDSAETPPVAIINETMAKRFWPGQDAIGKRFRLPAGGDGEFTPLIEVVGLARDAKYITLGEDPIPFFYLPLRQDYHPNLFLIVRSEASPGALMPGIRQEIRTLDGGLPVFNVQPITAQIEGALWLPRIGAFLLGVFGSLALVLASVGVYGVISYSVQQRTHEIGLRMALGARPLHILRMVIGQGLGLVAAGLGVGIAGALVLSRLVATLLFGISPNDPITFASTALLLVLVALAACYIPARRATRVDPVVALRYE